MPGSRGSDDSRNHSWLSPLQTSCRVDGIALFSILNWWNKSDQPGCRTGPERVVVSWENDSPLCSPLASSRIGGLVSTSFFDARNSRISLFSSGSDIRSSFGAPVRRLSPCSFALRKGPHLEALPFLSHREQ